LNLTVLVALYARSDAVRNVPAFALVGLCGRERSHDFSCCASPLAKPFFDGRLRVLLLKFA
jgi:hypothetical protein